MRCALTSPLFQWDHKSASLMIFYRVENSKGQGFYSAYPRPECVMDMYDSECHPNPHCDMLLLEHIPDTYIERDKWYVDKRFAFKNIEQLTNWIYKEYWRQKLQEYKFVVSVIEAEGWYGNTQAIFIRDTRVDIETLQLTEI